jgi:hypothetical protein
MIARRVREAWRPSSTRHRRGHRSATRQKPESKPGVRVDGRSTVGTDRATEGAAMAIRLWVHSARRPSTSRRVIEPVCLSVLLCLIGCSSPSGDASPTPTPTPTPLPTPTPTPSPTPTPTRTPTPTPSARYTVTIVPNPYDNTQTCAMDVGIAEPEIWGCYYGNATGVRENLIKQGWHLRGEVWVGDAHPCTGGPRWPC